MLLAVLVVKRDVLLKAVGDVAVVEHHAAVRGPRHDVEDVEQTPRIAPCEAEQGPRLDHLDLALPQLRVGGERPVEQHAQVLVLQRLQHIDLAAAQQRRNHLERGILGRGADQREDTLLHSAEQRILLRLVEAVYLVDEEKRRAGIEETLLAGRLDHLAHLLHARRDGRKREKRTFELRGHDPRQRGLAHARRSPQDERGHVARLEKPAEHTVGTDQMTLTDVFVEGAGPQSFGQGDIRHGWFVFQQSFSGCKDTHKPRAKANLFAVLPRRSIRGAAKVRISRPQKQIYLHFATKAIPI